MIWAIVYGYVFFGYLPDSATMGGTALVIGMVSIHSTANVSVAVSSLTQMRLVAAFRHTLLGARLYNRATAAINIDRGSVNVRSSVRS